MIKVLGGNNDLTFTLLHIKKIKRPKKYESLVVTCYSMHNMKILRAM